MKPGDLIYRKNLTRGVTVCEIVHITEHYVYAKSLSFSYAGRMRVTKKMLGRDTYDWTLSKEEAFKHIQKCMDKADELKKDLGLQKEALGV